MKQPKVSVIIPAYNQADYLGEAIQSVLDQTYSSFEVIVVNDASPDHTDEVVKRYNDPRLKYIVHEENRMLPATRNTGIRAATGEIIALLDADDIFHPEKLQAHADFLEKHPEVGATYNARLDIYTSVKSIFQLSRPPLTVNLADLVLGFPFAPSDMVLRRDWIFQIGLFDESYTLFSEDLDINCRLALAGCQFASVNRVLNYRRFHPSRVIKNISGRLGAHFRALEMTFSDQRCPVEVLALRDMAFRNKYLAWACFAFAQNETTLGQGYIREAVRLDPTILEGKPYEIVNVLLDFSVSHGGVNYEAHLKKAFAQLPPEITLPSEQYCWAVARGHLLKGIRAVMWDQPEDKQAYFAQARHLGAEVDEFLVRYLAYQLSSYELEFGYEASLSVLRKLEPYLKEVGNWRNISSLKGQFLLNGAFESYRAGDHTTLSIKILRAIFSNPYYLGNRGVLSILFRSLVGMRPQSND